MFILLCYIVGDNICVVSDHAKSPSLWDQASLKLVEAITSVPTRRTSVIFSYLLNKSGRLLLSDMWIPF